MNDLDKLIEAVEAGFPDYALLEYDGFCDTFKQDFRDAYHGSLDAAKELHEALLPGWHWKADDGQGQEGPFWSVFRYTNKQWTETESHEGQAESAHASRSWLLAILKAYRAQVTS